MLPDTFAPGLLGEVLRISNNYNPATRTCADAALLDQLPLIFGAHVSVLLDHAAARRGLRLRRDHRVVPTGGQNCGPVP